jgi:hypothetical protein
MHFPPVEVRVPAVDSTVEEGSMAEEAATLEEVGTDERQASDVDNSTEERRK